MVVILPENIFICNRYRVGCMHLEVVIDFISILNRKLHPKFIFIAIEGMKKMLENWMLKSVISRYFKKITEGMRVSCDTINLQSNALYAKINLNSMVHLELAVIKFS